MKNDVSGLLAPFQSPSGDVIRESIRRGWIIGLPNAQRLLDRKCITEDLRTKLRSLPIATAIATSLLAASSGAVAGSFVGKTITIVRAPDTRPCTFFSLDGVYPADPVTPNSGWFVLRQAAVGYKENLAILMSAKLTGRPVNVGTSGTFVSECGAVEAVVVELP